MTSIATKNAEIQGMMRKFAAKWAEVLPKLQKDPSVPVSYVLDTIDALINNIGNPVADIETSIINQLSVAEGFTFGGLFGGNVVLKEVSDTLLAQIRSATANATSTMRFLINDRLVPLRNAAAQARAQGAKMMKIPVAGVGTELFSDPFDQTVLATMQNGAAALIAVTGIQEGINSSAIGRFAGTVVDGAQAALGALTALASAIGTIGAGFYEVFKTLVTVAKVALLGGVAYVGYTFYTEARGQQRLQQAPQPQPNPRRRRARARRYLR